MAEDFRIIFLGQWAVRLWRKFENNLTQKQKDPTYNVSPKETVPDNTGKGPSNYKMWNTRGPIRISDKNLNR